jgi:hypothetical protein
MKGLLIPYQIVEIIVGCILFVPIYIFFLKCTGEQIQYEGVFLTTVFVGILLFIKNIMMNYYLMVQQNRTEGMIENI